MYSIILGSLQKHFSTFRELFLNGRLEHFIMTWDNWQEDSIFIWNAELKYGVFLTEHWLDICLKYFLVLPTDDVVLL